MGQVVRSADSRKYYVFSVWTAAISQLAQSNMLVRMEAEKSREVHRSCPSISSSTRCMLGAEQNTVEDLWESGRSQTILILDKATEVYDGRTRRTVANVYAAARNGRSMGGFGAGIRSFQRPP